MKASITGAKILPKYIVDLPTRTIVVLNIKTEVTKYDVRQLYVAQFNDLFLGVEYPYLIFIPKSHKSYHLTNSTIPFIVLNLSTDS